MLPIVEGGALSGEIIIADLDSERTGLAVEACRQTRVDAARLLGLIDVGEDTYFDRSDTAPDADVTAKNASMLRTIMSRMDVALAALEPQDS